MKKFMKAVLILCFIFTSFQCVLGAYSSIILIINEGEKWRGAVLLVFSSILFILNVYVFRKIKIE